MKHLALVILATAIFFFYWNYTQRFEVLSITIDQPCVYGIGDPIKDMCAYKNAIVKSEFFPRHYILYSEGLPGKIILKSDDIIAMAFKVDSDNLTWRSYAWLALYFGALMLIGLSVFRDYKVHAHGSGV